MRMWKGRSGRAVPRAGSFLEVCGEQSGVWDEISAKAYLLARGQIPWWGEGTKNVMRIIFHKCHTAELRKQDIPRLTDIKSCNRPESLATRPSLPDNAKLSPRMAEMPYCFSSWAADGISNIGYFTER